MGCPLERSRRDPVFLSQSSPTLVLGRDCMIKAASSSYLAATGRREDELVAINVFEAFPENPATPGSTKDFTDSVDRVLATRRPHHVGPLRYDILDPCRPGEFIEKRWVVVNTPIRDGDDVIGIMVRVEDITIADENLLNAFRAYRDVLAEGDLRTSTARRRVEAATACLAMMHSYTALAAEVTNLRLALRSRPTIEQAKGIIMADRRCGPDEAFEVLKQLSMDTNVRVADVAAAFVYQVREAG